MISLMKNIFIYTSQREKNESEILSIKFLSFITIKWNIKLIFNLPFSNFQTIPDAWYYFFAEAGQIKKSIMIMWNGILEINVPIKPDFVLTVGLQLAAQRPSFPPLAWLTVSMFDTSLKSKAWKGNRIKFSVSSPCSLLF